MRLAGPYFLKSKSDHSQTTNSDSVSQNMQADTFHKPITNLLGNSSASLSSGKQT